MVSICIPTYNNLALFRQCLSSVLMQDFTDYEIVVSDDSTNSEIEHYVAGLNVSSLVYQRNNPGLGTPANWNNCLQLASRSYIKFLHHDDYFTKKDALSRFVYSLENNPGADFSFCYSHIHFKRDNSFYVHRQTDTQLKRLHSDPEFLFFRNVVGAPSAVFFKKDNSVLFDVQYKWLVDVDFYIRYLKKHNAFVAIPEALVTVTDGEAGQVTQEVAVNKELVIRENLLLFSHLYSKKMNHKKLYLFFQELFTGFDVESYDALKKITAIPQNLQALLRVTFMDLKKNRLLKKVKKRLLTSRYNKLIFKIERF